MNSSPAPTAPTSRRRACARGALVGLALLAACGSRETSPPRSTVADSARIADVAARERARIAGEAGSRVGIEDLPSWLARLPGPLPPGDGRIRIVVLATNDFHGALEPLTPSWARGDTVGGAANLAAYVRAIEARHPGRVIHLDGGDVMQGTVISNLTAGRSTVAFFNELGVDAAAVGNHDFDWTVDTLRVRMEQAAFPWLTANTFVKGTGERPAWARPYAWLEVAGLSVAVIGASTVQTPTTTMPDNVEHLEFHDVAEVVDEIAPRLVDEGADLVIVAVHAGAIVDREGGAVGEIADAARGISAPVDLIVSGHTHTRVNAVVNGIPVVQAGSSGAALGVVTLTYDPAAGRVADASIDIVTVRAAEVEPDPEIAALVARWADQVDEIADRPIATLAGPLERVREEESALGDLIADAQRRWTGAEVAVVNGGGIRRGLPAGPVTFRDVFAVQPFQNALIRLEATGAELRGVLEDAVADRVAQVSGVRFSYDPTRPVGERVREAELEDTGEAIVADGAVVAPPDRTFTLVVNSFMASGGSGYDGVEAIDPAVLTGLVDSEVLADHLSSLPQPVDYRVRGRITRLAEWPASREE